MSAPVWVLSVDLQTKTASFVSGMGDAAKSARSAFTDIKSGAGEMGEHVSTNMFASRHAIMAVSEAFGVQVPRAITALLAHIGPIGAALEAAFPFAAIALGAVLLIEHLEKLKAEGIKLTEDQMKFGTAVQSAFNTLDQRLLQAGIKSDELHNDHLGALRKQLELIDQQSMAELVESFAKVAKAADVVFGDIQAHWYSMGIGSAGAKHALDDFQNKYESLLRQGKKGEATDLLSGTKASAERILALQKQLTSQSGSLLTGKADDGSALKALEARSELSKAGVGYTENEVKAQQILVDALNDQVTIEEKVAALKKADSGNATASTGKDLAALSAEGARIAAEHKQKMGELALAAEREQANVSNSIHEASIAERLASDLHLADEEYRIQSQGNANLIAALDRGGKDYQNQLRNLQDKGLELRAQHENAVAALTGKAQEERYRKSLSDLEESERDAIEATQTGSAARLAAIDAALRNEEEQNLTATEHYKELVTQRVEVARQAGEEQAKLTAEYGKLQADSVQKMGELALAADREAQAVRDSARRMTIQQRTAEELAAANAEYALKLTAMQREESTLDKGAKDYQNKLAEIQNKERQLIQAHQNELTAIKDKAEIDRNQKILSAENQFNDQIASGLTEVLMGHKSFASMMNSLGDQVVTGMMQNALKSILANDMTKESDAAAAARKAYLTGQEIGGPAGFILGPIMAAGAFASVMAFRSGTDYVPGIGRGDTVPAMLEPGEGVVPGGVMDGLREMARNGSMGGGGTHYHAPIHYAPVVQAIDADGVKGMLDKHAKTFQGHVENTLRRMNK